MEHALVLSISPCSVEGTSTNPFLRGLLGRAAGFCLPCITGGVIAQAGEQLAVCRDISSAPSSTCCSSIRNLNNGPPTEVR